MAVLVLLLLAVGPGAFGHANQAVLGVSGASKICQMKLLSDNGMKLIRCMHTRVVSTVLVVLLVDGWQQHAAPAQVLLQLLASIAHERVLHLPQSISDCIATLLLLLEHLRSGKCCRQVH
jgi:hypothetical protein